MRNVVFCSGYSAFNHIRNLQNHIGGVMISLFDLSVVEHGFDTRWFKLKTQRLVFVASLLSTKK